MNKNVHYQEIKHKYCHLARKGELNYQKNHIGQMDEYITIRTNFVQLQFIKHLNRKVSDNCDTSGQMYNIHMITK